MSGTEKKELTEQDLGNIILCEPITSRGIGALQELDLQNIVDEDFFFENLYIKPKYQYEQFSDITDGQSSDTTIEEPLHYIYSVTNEMFKDKKKKLELFNSKFTSDAKGQSPLYIIGTTGNGKSIEVHEKIRNPRRNNKTIESNRIIYNLENSLPEITHGITFSLDEKQEEDALWLIYNVLLKELYNLVEKNYKIVSLIASNHYKYFEKRNSTNDTENQIFLDIKNFKPGKLNSEKKMFENMIKLTEPKNAKRSIEKILKITMNLMYCINPRNKNYIIFDNLEHHIELNEQYIVIHNSVLSAIYKSANRVMLAMEDIYNPIKRYESWKAFKIIIVMRRTTGHLIERNTVHYATKLLEMGNDYTGHFDIWRIWEEKKKHLWEKYLKEKYDPKQSSDILWIINDMMRDRPFFVSGTSYQELISPLMNTGIRRNGRAQAYAALKVHELIIKNSNCYIDYVKYKKLLEERTKEITEIRYMYRRALLEIQYKWMIYPYEARIRFEKLLLGKLSGTNDTDEEDKNGKKIISQKVLLADTEKNNATLVRRILSYLSNFVDHSTYGENNNKGGFKTGMFATKSLYDVMKCIFLNPSEERTEEWNYNDHFLPLAKVLTSLGNMSHDATKAAPFLILDINDPRIDSTDSETQVADILKEIWEDGTKNSNSSRYKYTDYGVRLTEAGNVFLSDIQPSFSFFAALYCIEEVPLFFLTDPNRIKFVVKSIYKEANNLCKIYEQAAHSFCGSNIPLHEGKYLPKHKGESVTFRQRVKALHSNHLSHYIKYIEKNADILDLENVKSDLICYIRNTISGYNNWKTGRGSDNCF